MSGRARRSRPPTKYRDDSPDDESEEPSRGGKQDSDFEPSESEGEEEAVGGKEGGDSDPEFRLSEESDEEWEERPRKRKRTPPPEGTRRSRRIAESAPVFHVDELDWTELEEEEEEGPSRRVARPVRGAALRSGLVAPPPDGQLPDSLAGSAQPSKAGSPAGGGGEGRGAGQVQPAGLPCVRSPDGSLVTRDYDEARLAAELAAVRGMWEMAAALDFLALFAPQLKLRVQFSAAELERELVLGLGDAGLLAQLHAEILKGISPKSDVAPSNWQVHLGNKLRYHWKTTLAGGECPFKPDKYFEAAAYAGLPSVDRVRALHYILCVRADREDVTLRLADAGAIDGFAPPPGATETLAVFRRVPLGRDAAGREYHVVQVAAGEGGASLSARLYCCTPAPPHALPESEETRRARRTREAPAVAGAGRAVHDPTWLQSARAELDLLDPPAMAGWELAAEGLDQMAELGAALEASAHAEEAGLGATVARALVPHLRAAAEEHERQRARAAEEEAARQREAEAAALAAAAAAANGEAGQPGSQDEGEEDASEQDGDTQPGQSSGSHDSGGQSEEAAAEGEEGRRHRRLSPLPEPATTARAGARRGRSAPAVKEEVEPGACSNERAARRSRAGSRRASRSASAADLAAKREAEPA